MLDLGWSFLEIDSYAKHVLNPYALIRFDIFEKKWFKVP